MSQQATSPAFMSRHRWISHTQPLRITTMPRPPPLQLQFDNMFPGMVRPRMQVKSLLTGAYQSNWRMLVLCLATINALRLFFSASGAIDDLKVDLAQNNPALAGVSKTLATIYTIACGIELFGAAGAFLQRRVLIRAYAYLAFLSAALITGAGVITTAAYFTFADELLRECVALATAGQLGSKSLFRGDPWPSTTLSSSDAQTQCLDVWASESVSQVVSAALFYLLPSAIFCLIVYVYYCQTVDATHPASLTSTARGSAIMMAAYEPLPDSDAPGPVNAHRRPAPALGKRRTTISPRSYHQAAGTVASAVSSGSSLSPGPPSFSVAPDPRVYQGFRLSAGPEEAEFI